MLGFAAAVPLRSVSRIVGEEFGVKEGKTQTEQIVRNAKICHSRALCARGICFFLVCGESRFLASLGTIKAALLAPHDALAGQKREGVAYAFCVRRTTTLNSAEVWVVTGSFTGVRDFR